MATLNDWLEGARLRTLPVSVAPVIAGSAIAAQIGAFSWPRALLAAGVALSLQVGVNFANDYSDGIRGTDDVRSGPPRLTGGGLTSPARVKAAAWLSFALAGLAGLVLVVLCQQWWLLAVGLACVAAGWYYTGGSRPYGYMGLGEVFVFIFFGLVATAGTTYTQALSVPWTGWVSAVGMGSVACAALMVNNIRDIPTDSQCGKRTLAVRLGQRRARWAFAGMIALPVILTAALLPAHTGGWGRLGVALAGWLFTTAWAAAICRPVLAGLSGRGLIRVLKHTGLFEVAWALLIVLIFV